MVRGCESAAPAPTYPLPYTSPRVPTHLSMWTGMHGVGQDKVLTSTFAGAVLTFIQQTFPVWVMVHTRGFVCLSACFECISVCMFA